MLLTENIPDRAVDLTMSSSADRVTPGTTTTAVEGEGRNEDDPERGIPTRQSTRSSAAPTSSTSSNFDATELDTRSTPLSQIPSRGFFTSPSKSTSANASSGSPSLSPHLKSLVASYATSSIAHSSRSAINALVSDSTSLSSSSPSGVNVLRSYRRAGWWSQFTILSGRSFKNLYRNPMLMLSHYVVSILVACAYLLFRTFVSWCLSREWY